MIDTEPVKKDIPTVNLCECGCGETVTPGKRFLHGHFAKTQKLDKPVSPEIIVKTPSVNVKDFFGKYDKNATKPGWTYTNRVAALETEVKSGEKALKDGHVGPQRIMEFTADLENKKERLSSIHESHHKAKIALRENPDAFNKRRVELGKIISEAMPSKTDVEKRRANPHRIAQLEKSGLGALKTEFQIISRLMGENSNVGYLQRD